MRISTTTSSVTLTKLPTVGAVIPKSDQTKDVRPRMCTTSPSSRASTWKVTGAWTPLISNWPIISMETSSPSEKPAGRGRASGRVKCGDRVVGEHLLPDVAVSAGLVAFELVELDVDNGEPTVEVDLTGKGGGADYGVVGAGEGSIASLRQ